MVTFDFGASSSPFSGSKITIFLIVQLYVDIKLFFTKHLNRVLEEIESNFILFRGLYLKF